MKKKCMECGNEQETGKFCGKCGMKFEDGRVGGSVPNVESISAENPKVEVYTSASSGAVVQPTVSNQPNEHVEKVKDQSKKFWNYFMKYIKNPSEIFAVGDREIVNGLISIFIFAFILGVTVYISISSFARSAMGGLGELFVEEYTGPPFFTIFSSVLMFILVSAALVVGALLIISKLFGPGNSWKELISYYGAFILISSVLATIGLLLIFIKSFVFGNIIVILSYLMMLMIIPTFIISKLLVSKSKSVDKFYGYLLYIILFIIIFWIYITILADSTIGQIINQLQGW